MFGIFTGQLAFSAVSIVAKKAFETSVAQSLKGIGQAINTRYRGNAELMHLKDELESRLKMLGLPIDICAHFVTQGNTALQEALGAALRVLERIEEFQASLVQHDISRAQGVEASSPDPVATTARHIKELRGLIASLDSLLPYLNLAISAAGLLASAEPCPISPARLMTASWRLRSAELAPGPPLFSIHQATWHEERQLSSSAGPSMSESFPLCSIHVRRPPGGAGDVAGPGGHGAAPAGAEGGGGSEGGPGWEYELVVQQSLKDGRFHEEGEEPGEARIQVSSIIGMEWATTQSLNQGQNEYRPALVLHVVSSTASCGTAVQGTAMGGTVSTAGPGAKPGAAPLQPHPITPPAMPTRSSSRLGGAGAGPSSSSSSASKAAAGPGAGPGAGAAAGGQAGAKAPLSAPPAAGREQQLTPPGHAVAATPVAAGAGATGGGGVGGGSNGSAVGAALEGPGAGVVRRYAIQCSWQPSGGAGSTAGGAESEDEAPSPEEWAALGELEYVLRLCILESREQAPHFTVQDERIRMAFEETTVLPALGAPGALGAGAIGGAPGGAGGRGSTVRRASTAARRRGSLLGPPASAGGALARAGQGSGSGAEVDAVAAELGRRLAFSGGDASPPPGSSRAGFGFVSPLQ